MLRRSFGLILVLAASALASAAQAGVPETRLPCLECHPGVSLKDTVHISLACTDCHTGLIPRPGKPPHQSKKDLPTPTCGASCHAVPAGLGPGENPTAYADSVHGRAYLERHEPEVARCWDCHGDHSIRPVKDAGSPVNRRNIPLTCSRCHEDMAVVLKYNIHASSPFREYSRSVHGRNVVTTGGPEFAAVCTDCHGVHDIQGVGSSSRLQAREPRTCGHCHRQAYDEYASSIHGREASKGNPDVPLCIDCHGEHAMARPGSPGSPTAKAHIPDTCSVCHARPEIMKKYGVPVDRIATFIDSFHGIAVGMGGKEEATCVDCHGVHDIRPASDPGSKVYPANLAQTCAQSHCHPQMTSKIAGTRIHRDYGRRGSGAPYYVRKIFLWAVLLAAVLSLVFFLPLLVRRVGGRTRT